MSELTTTAASPAVNLSVASSTSLKRRLVAAGLSTVIPGAGQLFLGQRRRGLILLLILLAVLSGFWPLRLLRFYPGFVLLYCGWIVLYVYALCSALLARTSPTNAMLSKWWLVAALPVVALTLSLLGQTVTRSSGFRSFTVPSTSMERTLLQGDHIVADMHYYRSRRPDRRDIIVFVKDRTFFVKRVIAVGGDSIEGSNGVIFLLGEAQDEPYVEHTGTQGPNWMKNFGPVVIPNGKCFVMGDNRDLSLDSRSAEFGLIDDGSIVGKTLYIFGSDRAGRGIR